MEIVSASTEEELSKFLVGHKVPVEKYGDKGTKRIEDLFQEITEGESKLFVEGGRLIRLLEVVKVTVRHRNLHLTEDRQVFNDGRGERRRGISGLAEKIMVGELPIYTAQRALREELGIIGYRFLMQKGKESEEKESPSYPGLVSRYTYHTFEAHLAEEEFCPEGYVEEQDDKTTYFVWVRD